MPIGEVNEEAELTPLFPVVEDVPKVVVRQTCHRSKPFKTDPHPYCMALGIVSNSRLETPSSSSGSAERRNSPTTTTLGPEAMETPRSKD